MKTKSILDRSFHYTPSVETDLRKTFARLRREQRKVTKIDAVASANVSSIARRLNGGKH